ncbi:MAG: PaaI family thioesterase [Burkholderiaceae bacterium]|nr:PaaI family thioesterase [Burkholderiaceae bacterium]
MSEQLKFAQKVLQAQPFSRLLGAELSAFEPGKAELRLAIKADLQQQHGFVHGGVLSYLADNALTFAGGSMLENNALTGEFKINYLRPAVGDMLIARATVKYAGKQQAVSQCDVFVVKDGEEKLCAVAQGTIVKV